MPVYDRNTLKTLIKEIKAGTFSSAYLLTGDRYLCRQAADQISRALCSPGGTVHPIDGDTEDGNATVAKLRNFSLLPDRQIFQVNGSRLFHSEKIARSLWNRAVKAMDNNRPERAVAHLRAMMEAGGLDSRDPGNDPGGLSAAAWKKHFGFAKPGSGLGWTEQLLKADTSHTSPPPAPSPTAEDHGEILQKALTTGIPENNTLLLLAEEVDKRKKLYKFFKKEQTVIDLGVDSGSGFQAKKEQRSVLREQVNTILEDMGKSMAPDVYEQLFERVGFHPVAVVMETEKVALYAGDKQQITLADLNAVVGRTRQEALFELTHALGEKNLKDALLLSTRLRENGIHELAVVATLRNFTRSLLLFRSLQEQEQYGIRPNISHRFFQEQCLPNLKRNERWKKELSGHPYALYMRFTTASLFPLARLRSWLRMILDAERRLKGSPVYSDTVLHHLILSMLTIEDKGNLQN